MKLEQFLQILEEKGKLKVIDEPLDVELEIPHTAYVEVKKPDSKVLLFKNPVHKGKKYSTPVLMNTFADFEITRLIFGKHPDEIANQIQQFLEFSPPESFKEKVSTLSKLLKLKNIFPKRKNKKGECQQVVYKGEDVNLDILPILKTWPKDAGRFITAGQVYTKSLDGKKHNLGLYRIQQLSKNKLIMHWQVHKDGSHFFSEYKKANKNMPVAVAIGGDPLYFWCGQAPLPEGIFELMLYGFIREKNPQLVRCITNDLFVPEDADIVIEGFVDPKEFAPEGPFGDHTGYYTPQELFPVMTVEAVTMKKKPVYQATVVGKPPLEDKYMGWATERIFLPLLRTTAPDLIDYHMPENGCFHNLLVAKIQPRYKGHSKQIMHALWGVGQMSFLKHAVFVDQTAPDLTDYENLTKHVLNRLTQKSFLITEGIVDQLDHASYEALVGGKLGIDATGKEVEKACEPLPDEELLSRVKSLDKDILQLKTYFKNTANPITVFKIKKTKPVKQIFNKLKSLKKHIKIAVFVDDYMNDLDNLYMLVWRVSNNVDALYDVWIEEIWGVDATAKSEIDGYKRKWPEDTHCDKEVIENLRTKGIIDVDEEFLRKYQIIELKQKEH